MKNVTRIHAAVLLAAVWLFGCQQSFAECGIASTYSSGSKTANGERYNHMGVSAAHKSLPFGSRVVVRNQRTGRSITVRINDRGPFIAGRIIDLSTGAKNALGMGGLAPVCLEVVSYGGGGRGVQNAVLRSPAGKRQASRHRQYAKVHTRARHARIHHRARYAHRTNHRRRSASLS